MTRIAIDDPEVEERMGEAVVSRDGYVDGVLYGACRE